MEYKYYKNGNIHVRYDSDIDGYNDEHTYAAMICIIYNSMLDCVEYENDDSYFPTIAIINHVNDKTYDYVIHYDDIDKFFAGKWIILHGIDEHAYIKIPPFYDNYEFHMHDKKYRLYKLINTPDEEFQAEMHLFGVYFYNVSPTYAPEIKRIGMLVPYGMKVRYM